jgi:hypothetical protein
MAALEGALLEDKLRTNRLDSCQQRLRLLQGSLSQFHRPVGSRKSARDVAILSIDGAWASVEK